jgi:hypothetical protein
MVAGRPVLKMFGNARPSLQAVYRTKAIKIQTASRRTPSHALSRSFDYFLAGLAGALASFFGFLASFFGFAAPFAMIRSSDLMAQKANQKNLARTRGVDARASKIGAKTLLIALDDTQPQLSCLGFGHSAGWLRRRFL